MSKLHILTIAITAGLAACAARAPQTTIATVRYACGNAQIERVGDQLHLGLGAMPASLGWHDDEGDHFVSWPQSTTDVVATEYVIPADRRKDAVEKHYDTSAGYSTTDWRLVRKQSCRAEGGYNDALARFMDGASIDEVARQLDLANPGDARKLVRQAIHSLQKKYLASTN
jgi:hypothetical protein